MFCRSCPTQLVAFPKTSKCDKMSLFYICARNSTAILTAMPKKLCQECFAQWHDCWSKKAYMLKASTSRVTHVMLRAYYALVQRPCDHPTCYVILHPDMLISYLFLKVLWVHHTSSYITKNCGRVFTAYVMVPMHTIGWSLLLWTEYTKYSEWHT
jgi:hypothetical protein